jgi:diamine N-acetyltransferase
MLLIKKTDDYRLIGALNESVQNYHHQSYPDVFKPYDKDEVTEVLKKLMSQDNVTVFLAEQNDDPIGYVLLIKNEIKENAYMFGYTTLLVDQIMVVPGCRNKGVGKALINKVFELAKDSGIDRIDLNHWSQNENARIFFQAAGFERFNEKMWKFL